MTRDPYLAVGLARNPFVAEQQPGVDDAVFLDVGCPDPPAAGVVELVGCRGAGKTTHLVRWSTQLEGRYHHVEVGPGRLRPLPVARVAAWDEVDRVPGPLLRLSVARARRQGSLLLLGSHRATGLADVTHVMPTPTAAGVRRFFDRRVAAVTLPGQDRPPLALSAQDAARIARQADGSWRDVGSALHVWTALQVG